MQPIVEQIKKLAEQQSDLVGFYRQTIESVAESCDALAAAVWDCSVLPFHATCQYSRDSSRPVHVGISQHEHIELLQRAINQDDVVQTDVNHNSETQNSVVLVGRVQRGSAHDLIEVFCPTDQPDEYYAAAREQLRLCCAAVSESLASNSFALRPLPAAATPPLSTVQALQGFEEFAANVHSSIDFQAACHNIVNEAQAVLKCDRVSIVRFDRKCRTIAVSGLPKINRRSNTIRALEKLGDAVLPASQQFWYPDEAMEVLPQIRQPLDQYLAIGVTRSLVVVPIFEQADESQPSPEQATERTRQRVIGGLVFENFTGQWQRKSMQPPIDRVARHSAVAYRNAYTHRELFLYPVWKGLGKVTGPRVLPRVLLGIVALAIMVVALFLIPSTLVISGQGELVPQSRRNVFAQVDGQISDVHVAQGTVVDIGDPLVTMTSNDLEIGLADIEHEIDLATRQIDALDRSRLTDAGGIDLEQADIERSSLMQRLESLEIRRGIYQEQIAELSVRSPLDGQVISSDLERRLLDRPIRKGQILMEVAATSGQWVIEMDLPDRRIGHLLRARRQSGQPLCVSFVLAADPGRRLTGTVSSVSLATQVKQDSGQTIRVTIVPDDTESIDIRQVRTDVSVRIECGTCSLGYAWLHDVNEFVQSKILFYLW